MLRPSASCQNAVQGHKTELLCSTPNPRVWRLLEQSFARMPANEDHVVDPQKKHGDDAYSACATQGQDVILMAGQARADAYTISWGNILERDIGLAGWLKKQQQDKVLN